MLVNEIVFCKMNMLTDPGTLPRNANIKQFPANKNTFFLRPRGILSNSQKGVEQSD